MAAHDNTILSRLERVGLGAIRPAEGLAALQQALSGDLLFTRRCLPCLYSRLDKIGLIGKLGIDVACWKKPVGRKTICREHTCPNSNLIRIWPNHAENAGYKLVQIEKSNWVLYGLWPATSSVVAALSPWGFKLNRPRVTKS